MTDIKKFVDDILTGGLKNVNNSSPEAYVKRIKSQPNPMFRGYSPEQMHVLLYSLFAPGCVVELRPFSTEDAMQSPVLAKSYTLLRIMERTGRLKLTEDGTIPEEIFLELYRLNHPDATLQTLKDNQIEEDDDYELFLALVLLQDCEFILSEGLRFSLNPKNRISTKKPQILFKELITYYAEYLIDFFDHEIVEEVGDLGIGYSIALLAMDGNNYKSPSAYAENYLTAFPEIINSIMEGIYADREADKTNNRSDEELIAETKAWLSQIYATRVFKNFLLSFGLIELEDKTADISDTRVRKTALFDKFFKVSTPQQSSRIANGLFD